MRIKKRRPTYLSAGAAMVILSALFLGACAGVNKASVQQDIGKAEAAVNNARGGEAMTHAPLELRLAEEKLLKARSQFENNNYQEAGWLAEEAFADANLAEAKSRSVKTREIAQQLQNTILALQDEIKRQQPQ
jgi:hypothetical protein